MQTTDIDTIAAEYAAAARQLDALAPAVLAALDVIAAIDARVQSMFPDFDDIHTLCGRRAVDEVIDRIGISGF